MLLPVPPVALVYQSKPVPVAVNAVAVAPSQRFSGVVTVGAVGIVFIVTVMAARLLSQLVLEDVWLT